MRFWSFFIAVFLAGSVHASGPFVTLASTTSTENSGLYDAILPMFEDATGIDVRVVAVGTGQALKLAENGDADLLIVHHRPSEEAFVAAGFGTDRRDLMYNDYVLIGPDNNPAGITMTDGIETAFQKIASTQSDFVSRGDDSGTHKKELELWSMSATPTDGAWYLDVGRGMGAALNIAAARGAYILSDRGTWLSFQNKSGLKMIFEGVPPLFNPYGVILVNPDRHPHVKADLAQELRDWLLSYDGQAAIAGFEIAGQQLFFPNAAPTPIEDKSNAD